MTTSELLLEDAESVADLATYVARARVLDDDGAVRLQASGQSLALWVGVLKGRGLTGEGTTLGLRVLRLSAPAEVDDVVPLAAVADRLARMSDGGSLALPVPPMTVRMSWAAVSPPRSDWRPLGDLPIGTLESAARAGIAEVTQGAPDGSGAAAVETLRQRVWSKPMATPGGADGLPSGVAFAAHSLGFLIGDTASVFASGRWFRVTTPAGHVLIR